MPEVGTAQMTETNNINSLLGVSYGSMNKAYPQPYLHWTIFNQEPSSGSHGP